MGPRGAAAEALARHLHDALEQVREDMAKVEFWAEAMTSFSEPVPDYGEDDVKVWLPSEQAKTISSSRKNMPQKQSGSPSRR